MSSTPKAHYFQTEWIRPTDETPDVDVCIYGGSSAGVAAGVTLARRGRRVVILNPARHVGGMTTGGLGWTDSGKKYVIGGLARQFYRDVGRHYGEDEVWNFEPHVAAKVYDEWIESSGVTVYACEFLDRAVMQDGRIHSIRMLSGLEVTARYFIDATYEGDLMARAGVSYTVGREGNDVYGETLNGIQVRHLHQFSHPVDPYVVAGDPSSGLLPYVEPVDAHELQGQGDHRIQAYCFRVCLTDDPDLRLEWTKPEGFDPREYVIASRWYQSEKDERNDTLRADGRLAKFDRLHRPHKTDTNNHGPVSSDYIGANYDWPEASYERREEIFQQHVTYQQGLYWYLSNDPSIPARYREAFSQWGLAKDEFVDTGNWPHQLYIREARRMVSDYVLTEHDCMHRTACDDPVGMGSYTMDSHNCQRFVHNGRVLNEGDVQVPTAGPYTVSYRSIVPKKGECANLFVPVCLSASHIAYGSVRMEPVFMILGESAAVAADLLLHDGGAVAVQELPYDALRGELDSAGQILSDPQGTTKSVS